MLFQKKLIWVSYGIFLFLGITGCSTYPNWLASSGPSNAKVSEINNKPDTSAIQVIDLNEDVTHQILSHQKHSLFSETFGVENSTEYLIGSGDIIQISIWEAPPAVLFISSMSASSSSNSSPQSVSNTSSVTNFPEQMVNSNGEINVPFAGRVHAAGNTVQQIETEIVHRLKKQANQPQVLIRIIKNNTANVTVVGEVASSTRMQLTSRGEHLLDALAAAGGIRQAVPINKITLQLTRQNKVSAIPLDLIIRDPKQNIALQPGDVITALYQPLSFIALGATGTTNGATGSNQEINYEAVGISLSQALGRISGLNDMRADAQGIFIFRFESADALNWPHKPTITNDGKVPVVYKVNLKDPTSFLVAQNFPIQNKDVIYIANSPGAELQKFLTLVLTATYPFFNLFNMGILRP